jgi:hypothetical protein
MLPSFTLPNTTKVVREEPQRFAQSKPGQSIRPLPLDMRKYYTNRDKAIELWNKLSVTRKEVRWDIFEELSKPWLLEFIKLEPEDKSAFKWGEFMLAIYGQIHSEAKDSQHPVESVIPPTYKCVISEPTEMIDDGPTEPRPSLYKGAVVA